MMNSEIIKLRPSNRSSVDNLHQETWDENRMIFHTNNDINKANKTPAKSTPRITNQT